MRLIWLTLTTVTLLGCGSKTRQFKPNETTNDSSDSSSSSQDSTAPDDDTGFCSRGCEIDGECITFGTTNPSDACEICEPTLNKTGWTQRSPSVCGNNTSPTSTDPTSPPGTTTTEVDPTDTSSPSPSTDPQEPSPTSTGGSDTGIESTSEPCTGACACADGCWINGNCVAPGTQKPGYECFVCDPSQRDDDYTIQVGANCGAAATECSAQDTCDAAGACKPNHHDDGKPCTAGECTAGECVLWENPFDCIVPSPPEIIPPDGDIYDWDPHHSSPIPTPTGGKIPDGRYVPVRVELFGYESGMFPLRSFEFKNGFVQVGHRYYDATGFPYAPQISFTGSYSTSGTQLTFDVTLCDTTYSDYVPNLAYSKTANGITTIDSVYNPSMTVVTLYRRE